MKILFVGNTCYWCCDIVNMAVDSKYVIVLHYFLSFIEDHVVVKKDGGSLFEVIRSLVSGGGFYFFL